jgi:hypothetical protein
MAEGDQQDMRLDFSNSVEDGGVVHLVQRGSGRLKDGEVELGMPGSQDGRGVSCGIILAAEQEDPQVFCGSRTHEGGHKIRSRHPGSRSASESFTSPYHRRAVGDVQLIFGQDGPDLTVAPAPDEKVGIYRRDLEEPSLPRSGEYGVDDRIHVQEVDGYAEQIQAVRGQFHSASLCEPSRSKNDFL